MAGTCHRRRSYWLETGFFRQVRELKVQRKNPASACFRVMFKHVASPNRRKKEIVHHTL
jgi:hypothetical protein